MYSCLRRFSLFITRLQNGMNRSNLMIDLGEGNRVPMAIGRAGTLHNQIAVAQHINFGANAILVLGGAGTRFDDQKQQNANTPRAGG